MALGRLDVEPDVVEVGRVEAEHGDVAEDDLAVGGGRAGGGEGAAVHRLGRRLGACGCRLREAHAFQAGRRGLQGASRACRSRARQLRATMSTRSMGRPSKRGPGGGGAVGDALHLFEVLLVVAAQEQGVDERAGLLPAVGRAPWGSAWRRSSGRRRRSPGPAAGRAGSRARRARPRCAARSSRPADSGRPGRSAGPTRGSGWKSGGVGAAAPRRRPANRRSRTAQGQTGGAWKASFPVKEKRRENGHGRDGFIMRAAWTGQAK